MYSYRMSQQASQLVSIIDRIAGGPWPVNIEELPGESQAASAVLQIFESLGAVISVADNSYEPSNSAAQYFLRSFAEYVRAGQPVLSGWGRAIPVTGESRDGLLNGPAMTFRMESLRGSWDAPVAIRSTEVAQAVIKARLGWRIGTRYLVRWDPGASGYQLIGGHRRSDDKTIEETMRRELEEEVPGILDSPLNDRLSHYAKSSVTQVSRTHGALTTYTMHFFTASFASKAPRISQSERWVTASDMARGRLKSGEEINQAGLAATFGDTKQALEDLPLSFSTVLRPPSKLMARQIFGSAAGCITLVASIAALVQFVAWIF